MGDAADSMWAMGAVRQHQKAERRQAAGQQFHEARQLAASFGLTLQRFSETHYRIRTEGMFWDIHPGNQRIRRSTPAVPFIFGLGSDWTLRDVVQQVENTLKAWREAREKAVAGKPATLVLIDEVIQDKPEGEIGGAST